MSVLAARDLMVSAKLGGDLVPVLRDFSLTLEQGRVVGLVGESGAGKSMVGRTIAQMLPPGFAVAAGSLLFGGRDLIAMPPNDRRALLGREIAFIPQEPLSALNPVLTIGQQLDEHLRRLGLGSPRERRARALDQLKAVHLPRGADLLRQYPHQISGGMCQRVLIAMAFASRPRHHNADEPTTALDVTIQARIVRLIAEMQERDGTAVLFITHDLRLAGQICDDILVLYAGRPVEYGPARAVLAAPAHPYSRCLQLANPPMSGARRTLASLPERMPGLSAYKDITGCAFAPRCPNA
ncbi:MAG: ABC transporter ATP-binding protein, partial [Xanthobacteraceae bacterium]